MVSRVRWNRVVDITTLAWFVMLVVGFMAFDADIVGMEPAITIPAWMEPYWDTVNWSTWCVFAADVWFKYRRAPTWKVFLRKHWFDIILLIPFFRILAVLRLLRLLKFLKFVKVAMAAYKGYRNSGRFRK